MMVTMLHSAFWAVSESLPVTPDSRSRLPSISIPNRGATDGSSKEQNSTTNTGNTIFSTLLTLRSCFITIWTLFLCGERLHDRRLDQRDQGHIGVGGHCNGSHQLRSQVIGNVNSGRAVSAADDTDGGCLSGCEQSGCHGKKESHIDAELAAAPSKRLTGLAIRGPKSVIAPTAMKIRHGNRLDFTPL